jgi:hypothetical protein
MREGCRAKISDDTYVHRRCEEERGSKGKRSSLRWVAVCTPDEVLSRARLGPRLLATGRGSRTQAEGRSNCVFSLFRSRRGGGGAAPSLSSHGARAPAALLLLLARRRRQRVCERRVRRAAAGAAAGRRPQGLELGTQPRHLCVAVGGARRGGRLRGGRGHCLPLPLHGARPQLSDSRREPHTAARAAPPAGRERRADAADAAAGAAGAGAAREGARGGRAARL